MENHPCRCEPCCCRTCLLAMLGPAQRAFTETGGWPFHTLGGEIPDHFCNGSVPLTREEGRSIRVTLELWTRADRKAT